jgi:predicted nucleic acid-binding protein
MIKLYLDNCCYNRPFDDQGQSLINIETEAKLIIQDKIKRGIYSLVWSFMLDSENDDNPSEEKREAIKPWKKIASEYCTASADILANAKTYMKIGLKHKDAIHLACAIKHKCDYFITTDKKFYNKNNHIKEIEIVNPLVFILETEVPI